MKLYTGQISLWRQLKKQGRVYIDTTVKTGVVAFAPTWDMVLGVKSGSMTEKEYTRQYFDLMDLKQVLYSQDWDELLRHSEVTLLCYCKSGDFCHRHLLASIVKDMCVARNLPCELAGELPSVL